MSRKFSTVPIGETVSKVSTCDPRTELAGGLFEYIDISLVNRETKRIEGSNKIAVEDAPSRARQIVKARDILVSTVRPNLNAVAQVPDNIDGAIASTGFTVLRPKQTVINARYLFQWVKNPEFVARMVENASGASYPAVSDRIIKDSMIPLPPLDEQHRIAAVLDKADALREKRRQAINKLDTLLQAVFLDMFGDPVKNPKSLEMIPFGKIFQSIRYGTGSPPPYVSEGEPFIRATNVKNGTIVGKDLKHISVSDAAKLEKCKLKHGDLIVVRSGVNSGDCALVPKEYDGACAAYDLIVKLEYEYAVFYNYLINSTYGKHLISKLTRRAAQPHLNADQLSNLALINPSYSARRKFVAFHGAVETIKTKQFHALERQSLLFHSLQQRAFKGELFNGKATAAALPQRIMSTSQPELFD